jgi:hypothetical protein
MEDFTALPNEWLDHLGDGRLTVPMFIILTYLKSSCTWENGTWRGEAMRIWYGVGANANGEFIELRQLQKHLRRLGECGYITSHHVPGRRGGYKIDINNYVTKRGRGKDAEEITLRPTDLKDLRDVPLSECAEEDAESNTESALTGRRECAESNTESACTQDVLDLNQDVQDRIDLKDVKEVKGQESKEGSKKGSEAPPPSSGRSESEEFKEWSERALRLVRKLNPVQDETTVSCEGPFAQMSVDYLERASVDPCDLVDYNWTHKAPKFPKLRISSCQWLWERVLKQGTNLRLVNEYVGHESDGCKECRAGRLVSWAKKQEETRKAAQVAAWQELENQRLEKLAQYEFRRVTKEELHQFGALRQGEWPSINKMLTAETYPVARPAAWDARHVDAAILTCLQKNESQTFESFTALVEGIMELDKETPWEMATTA